MFRVVENAVFGVIVIITQKGQVRPGCRMARQILDGAVYRRHPSVLVGGEAVRVVEIHLDEVLVVAVGASRPSASAVEEAAIRNAHVAAQQAGKRLAQCRIERVDQVRFALLRELSVRRVSGEIGKARPFHHQSTDGGHAVARGVGQPWGIKVDAVIRDSCWCVESEFESISQVLGLCKNGIGSGSIIVKL